MTCILLLVGSPRGRLSSSTSLTSYLSNQLQEKGETPKTLWITEQLVSMERTENMLEAIKEADYIVLTAPLYDDCQPYNVTKTMELAAEMGNLKGKRFIPIVNCGFPQVEQITLGVIPIYKMFAKKTGMNWIGSLAIGGGEGIQGSAGKTLEDIGGAADSIIAELKKIVDAITSDTLYQDVEVITFPKFLLHPWLGELMMWLNNRNWNSIVEKKGEKVDAKPYAK
jgi:hypothetical protein